MNMTNVNVFPNGVISPRYGISVTNSSCIIDTGKGGLLCESAR